MPSRPTLVVCALIHAYDDDGSYKTLITQVDNKSSRKGQWELPGGKVEYGETLAQAVGREMMEELYIQRDDFFSPQYWKPVTHGIQEVVIVDEVHYVLIPMIYGIMLDQRTRRMLETAMDIGHVQYNWHTYPDTRPMSPVDLSMILSGREHVYSRSNRYV